MALSGQQLFAGLDIGGTKIAAIIADRHGNIAASGAIATEPSLGSASAARRAIALLCELERSCSVEALTIGIGLPGLVDPASGKVLFLPNLPEDWRGFAIREQFEASLRRPAYVLNDARLAALGEYTFGTPSPAADMLFVTVGTGIGGGLILDGKLRLGPHGAAGELGHHTIHPDGLLCNCGSRGCLETVISGPVLCLAGRHLMESGCAPLLYKRVNGDGCRVTPSLMAEVANQGDVAVAEAIERAATYLGIGIANAVSITAVQEVVIGGGLVVMGDLLIGPVRKAIEERVRMFPSSSVRVRCSTLGANAGALGGVALAIEEYSRNLSTAQNPMMETMQ